MTLLNSPACAGPSAGRQPSTLNPAAPQPVTILVVKIAGRFKATAGEVVEYGDYATTAARAAAAKHFSVPEASIEVEPVNACLTARVKVSA